MKKQHGISLAKTISHFQHPTSKSFVGCPILILILFLAGCSTSYDKEIQKSLISAYGHDFKDYLFRASPVGNFGVGTMYAKDLKNPNKNPESGWLIGHPDTMFESTVSEKDRQTLLHNIFPEGTLGSKKLSKKITTGLSLEAVVPTLQGLLNVGGNVDFTKGVKVALSATEAINRRMNWTEFKGAITAGQIKSEVVSYVNRPDSFILGAADIVLKGFKAHVTVDKKANAGLHAKLNEAVGKVLGQDSSIKIKVSQSEEGTFDVESVNPVVAAVSWKNPPSARGPLLATNVPETEEWESANIDKQKLIALEKLLSQ